LTTRSRSSTE